MNPIEDEFYVTLLSNANLNVCPNNTVFNFTNILAKPIQLPRTEKWRVSLHSMSMTNVMERDLILYQKSEALQKELQHYIQRTKTFYRNTKDTDDQTKIEQRKILFDGLHDKMQIQREMNATIFNNKNPIYVDCEQLSPKFGESQTLTSIIAPAYDNKNTFIYYEPTCEQYFDFESPIISHITIKIRDSKGSILRNDMAQPTIIVLKFKKMEFNRLEYHTLYIDNGISDPANFSVKLPGTLVRDGTQNPWEMALTKISFSPIFNDFPRTNAWISLYKQKDMFDSIINAEGFLNWLKLEHVTQNFFITNLL